MPKFFPTQLPVKDTASVNSLANMACRQMARASYQVGHSSKFRAFLVFLPLDEVNDQGDPYSDLSAELFRSLLKCYLAV